MVMITIKHPPDTETSYSLIRDITSAGVTAPHRLTDLQVCLLVEISAVSCFGMFPTSVPESPGAGLQLGSLSSICLKWMHECQ